MRVSDWLKAAAILLNLVVTAWVLSQCDRLMRPADRTKAEPKAVSHALPSKERSGPDKAKPDMSEEAKVRAEKRMRREEALAQQHAHYLALEADLVAMVQSDIPAALAELTKAAKRYRNKLSDLKHLKKAEQWDRENPIKEAHARARSLTQEWHKIDLEAQKDREGPSLHTPVEIEALTKRLALFKRGGEEIEAFAAALAPLHGKVPENLLLSAIDAIPRAVLPKDAFDPCRDPAACPKPALEAPAQEKSPSYCVAASASTRDLAILISPSMGSQVLARLTPGQCGIALTGRRDNRTSPWASSFWQEIVVGGQTGWVREGIVTASTSTGVTPSAAGYLRGPERYCVDALRLRGQPLALLARPHPHAQVIVQILPTSCRLTGTGREAGQGLWIEVTHDYGYTGWVTASGLRSQH